MRIKGFIMSDKVFIVDGQAKTLTKNIDGTVTVTGTNLEDLTTSWLNSRIFHNFSADVNKIADIIDKTKDFYYQNIVGQISGVDWFFG